MDERILRRIDRASGVEDIVGVLEGLPPTDLQSLLLAVYRRRAGRMTAKAVLDRYEHSRFVTPASSSPRQLVEFDRHALSLVPDSYEPIELSPLAPLGAASVLGKVSQDWAVPTARNTEVVSDSTNVLALECALRRRRDRGSVVKLVSSHRLLRGQDYAIGGEPHFRLLGLVAAGRGRAFEFEALVEQLVYYARLLGDVRIALTPLAGTLADDVCANTTINVEVDSSRVSGRGYYIGVCFKIFGGDTELGDGGFVEWTQALLGDRKERLLIRHWQRTRRGVPPPRSMSASVRTRWRRASFPQVAQPTRLPPGRQAPGYARRMTELTRILSYGEFWTYLSRRVVRCGRRRASARPRQDPAPPRPPGSRAQEG